MRGSFQFFQATLMKLRHAKPVAPDRRRLKRPDVKNLARVLNAKRHGAKVANARRKPIGKIDPTHTLHIQRAFWKRVQAQFARLKGQVVKLVWVDDAFGLWAVENVAQTTFGEFPTFNEEYPGGPAYWSYLDGVQLNYDPDQPRDALGRFGSGGPGRGTDLVRSTVEAIAHEVTAGGKAALDAAGAVGRGLRLASKAAYKLAEGRYGRNQAIAIFGAAQATSWGISGVGAAMGVPIWVPAQGLISALPFVAIAETYLQMSRVLGTHNEEFEQLSHAQIEHLAKELVAEMQAVHAQLVRQHPTENAFCPTGEGGGVDPSCPPSKSSEQIAEERDKYLTRVYGPQDNSFRPWHPGFHDESEHPQISELARMAKRIMLGDNQQVSAVSYPLPINSDKNDGVSTELWDSHGVAMTLLDHPSKRMVAIEGKVGRKHISYDAQKDEIAYWIHRVDGIKPPKELKEKYGKKKTENELTLNDKDATPSGRFKFTTSKEKLDEFQKWLKEKYGSLITGQTQEALWDAFIKDGFARGAGRAFDDVRQSELMKRRPELFTDEHQKSVSDFYQGTRSEFLRSSFAHSADRERVELLASRAYDELENVTSDMSNKMSRVLADGMVTGSNPRDVARDMAKEVDIGSQRAETIARTEFIRAFAEGQLTALEKLGVEEVGVAVEFSTADDELVCLECAAMEGVVLKLDEARGVIPQHPNCRCAWIPANVGEDDEDQKRDKSEIDEALAAAGAESGAPISPDRPESILNTLRADFRSVLKWLRG